MRPFILSIHVSVISALAFTSCNKHKILEQEQIKVDAEREKVNSEIRAMDQKIASMPDTLNSGVITNQIEDLEKKAAAAEVEATAKLKKWTEIETAFLPLKTEAEAYKAKYTR